MVHSFYNFIILHESPSGRPFFNPLLEKTGFWPVLMSPFSGLGHHTCSDIILDIYPSITQNLLSISSLQTGVAVTGIHVFFLRKHK